MARYTEALGTVRQSAAAPRTVEGIAVPYGVVSLDTELGREAFAPGAFRDSVAHWMSRQDGAKMGYRAAHGEKPIGVVTALEDRPEGVWFSARIRPGPAGDEYLAQVDDGLNGVSIEPSANDLRNGKRTRDGTVIHKSARLLAIAGSVSPAYDGARVATRDMEEVMNETPAPEPTPTPAPTPTPPTEPDALEVAVRNATAARDAAAARREAAERGDAIAARPAAITITRDALIYGREAASLPDGSHPTFFHDGWLAAQGNRDAAERQYRYEQASNEVARQIEREALIAAFAGDVLSSELGGAFQNEYLPGLLVPRLIKGRPMGNFYSRFPISDGNPKIYPKVTTSTTVAAQSGEGVNPAASDFATTAVTVTPALIGFETVVSRQALDGSNPAAEAMIMQDAMEAYAQGSEAIVVTAVEAGSTASGTAITAATPYVGILGNVVKYATTRFSPGEGQFVPAALFGVLATQLSTGDGRPLLPAIAPVNADGTLTGVLGYELLGAQGAMSYGSTVNVVVTAKKSDFVIFESSIARFSYDAVTGPAGVRVGLWAYLGIGVRNVGGSLKVTAA
jgi:HK97 family phage prohead protease